MPRLLRCDRRNACWGVVPELDVASVAVVVVPIARVAVIGVSSALMSVGAMRRLGFPSVFLFSVSTLSSPPPVDDAVEGSSNNIGVMRLALMLWLRLRSVLACGVGCRLGF